MPLGLEKLRYSVRKNQLKIHFLTDDDVQKIQEVIDFLRTKVGLPKKEISFEELSDIFMDWKLLRGILHVLLLYFFRFKSRSVSELLSADEIKSIQSKGFIDLVDLRMDFYFWVEQEYQGVIPSNEYDSAITRYANRIGISKSKLIELLYLDDEDNKILVLEHEPTATEVLQVYNFEALSTILYYSKDVNVKLNLESGGLMAKNIYTQCKRKGLLCDFSVSANQLTITIYGPMQFYGRQTKYGLGIAFVIAQIFKNLELTGASSINIQINVNLRDKEYVVNIPPESLRNVRPPYEEPKWESYFDSNAEKRFYWTIKNARPRGWDIIREPDPIVLEGTIAVPDFALIKNNMRIYVELVGYWRETYVKKKLEKLKEIQKKNLPFLLLIDNKHKGTFDLLNIPIIYYKLDSHGRLVIPFNKFFTELKKLEEKYQTKT